MEPGLIVIKIKVNITGKFIFEGVGYLSSIEWQYLQITAFIIKNWITCHWIANQYNLLKLIYYIFIINNTKVYILTWVILDQFLHLYE